VRRTLPILVFLFVCGVLLHWYAGTFHSEFGRYQDEGMHYVTGLLVRDFIASGHWTHPMVFAKEYYMHFPKVGLGNWPPGFPLLQSAWTFLFGVSRQALLFFMIFLLAFLALTVYRAATEQFGTLYAVFGALLVVALPLSQAQAAMVMAEIPLALFSLLAVLAYIRFLEADRMRDAVWFALWTFCAIMTKGNGWAVLTVVPVLPLAGARMRIWRSSRFWLALVLIAALCVPYTLVTMSIVRNGWNTKSLPDLGYILLSLWVHTWMVIQAFGVPVMLVAIVGLVDRALLPRFRGKINLFWLGMAAYGACVVVFHGLVPTSIEPRKIYQIIPVICLFVIVGMDAMARRLQARTSLPNIRYGVAVFTAILFLTTNFYFLKPFRPGFAAAVENLIARPDTRGAAILISSNPYMQDAEAAIISEWAARERKAGTYLVRATKLLDRPARNEDGEAAYEVIYRSDEDGLRALDEVPIAYVIMHTTTTERPYQHHALIERLLAGHPDQWENIYESRRVLEQSHDIKIYRRRRDLRGIPVHFSMDLSDKIGSSVEAKPEMK